MTGGTKDITLVPGADIHNLVMAVFNNSHYATDPEYDAYRSSFLSGLKENLSQFRYSKMTETSYYAVCLSIMNLDEGYPGWREHIWPTTTAITDDDAEEYNISHAPASSLASALMRCYEQQHQRRQQRQEEERHRTTTIHPTTSCKLCPAYFHQVSELDQHVLMCHPVAVVASPVTPNASSTDAGEATSSITPTPIMLPTNNTTHRVCDGSTSPSSRPTPSIPSEGGPATTDRKSSTTEAPPASTNPSSFLSPNETDHLIAQLQSALNQLPPDVHPVRPYIVSYLNCRNQRKKKHFYRHVDFQLDSVSDIASHVCGNWAKHRLESSNHTLEHPPD